MGQRTGRRCIRLSSFLSGLPVPLRFSFSLSLSHPLSGHARPLSLPQTMHEALAPATVTASYISRGSGGGGTRVTSTDIKVVLAV